MLGDTVGVDVRPALGVAVDAGGDGVGVGIVAVRVDVGVDSVGVGVAVGDGVPATPGCTSYAPMSQAALPTPDRGRPR